MDRITVKDLEAVVRRVNRTVNGSEVEPWVRGEDGQLRATVGAYYLDGAYGGYELLRMSNENGGVTDVLASGHVPKRELYALMHAFLRGIEAVTPN